MKIYVLWLLVLLVVFQAYIVVETYPELHVLSHDAYLKQLENIKKLPSGSEDLVDIAYFAYFNGRHGRHLAHCTLILDVVMILLLAITIKGSYGSSKHAKEACKEVQQ